MNDKHIINVVGIGPGCEDMMTGQALYALEESDVIVGYPAYIDLLGERFKDKEFLSSPMTKEVDRCRMAFDSAASGKKVSLICSGDSGIYGLASLMYELLPEYPTCDLNVVPGVTAALSGASLLGAPVGNDLCLISLSDYLTPWDKIESRLRAAAKADLVIAIYNPASRRRSDYLMKACDILLEVLGKDLPCGIAENIGRDGANARICTLGELRDSSVNMFTTVFIGNSQTVVIDGKMVTRRGYQI